MRNPNHAFLALNEYEARLTPSTTYVDPNTTNSSTTYSDANFNTANIPIIGFDKVALIPGAKIDAGTTIRIKVVAEDGTVYDQTFTLPKDMTEQEVAAMIADNMKADGWDVEAKDGTLQINGHKDSTGAISRAKKVGAYAPQHGPDAQPKIGGSPIGGEGGIEIIDLKPQQQ